MLGMDPVVGELTLGQLPSEGGAAAGLAIFDQISNYFIRKIIALAT